MVTIKLPSFNFKHLFIRLFSRLKKAIKSLKRKTKKTKKQEQPRILDTHQKIEDPWFFCSLCSKFIQYSELIDGCNCCFCDNELFIMPYDEFKEEYLLASAKPSAL